MPGPAATSPGGGALPTRVAPWVIWCSPSSAGGASPSCPYAFALVTALVLRRQLPAAEIIDRPALAEGAAAAGAWTDFRVALRIARAPAVVVPIAMAFVAFVLIFGLFLTALPVTSRTSSPSVPARGAWCSASPPSPPPSFALSLGRLRARFGARRIVLAAWMMVAVGFAAVAGAPAVVLVLAGAGLYGFGEGALIPTLQDLVPAPPPPRAGPRSSPSSSAPSAPASRSAHCSSASC